GELLATANANAQWLLGGKQLAIELDVEPALPPLRTDRSKLNQILLNLLANAIKFTPDGGTITMRARLTANGIAIAVADTGVGIPAAEQGRVFDEFHQVDGSSSREYGGVGLGLALVRRLVELLGGTVAVASELGRGTT